MRSAVSTGTVAFCASMLVHGVLMLLGLNLLSRQAGPQFARGSANAQPPRVLIWDEPAAEPLPLRAVPQPPKPADASLQQNAPALQPPPSLPLLAVEPKPTIELEPELEKLEFGEANGKGAAAKSSPGDTPGQGRRGPQEQPYLSRDPVGRGMLADDPWRAQADARSGELSQAEHAAEAERAGLLGVASLVAEPQIAFQTPQPKLAEALLAPDLQQPKAGSGGVQPVQPTSPNPAETTNGPDMIGLVAAKEPERSITIAAPTVPSGAVPVPEIPAVEPAPRPPSNSIATPTAPTAPQPAKSASPANAVAADPAPMSDSESDAFSPTGTATIRAGRVLARLGREVKPIKPRLTLKGELDVISLASPSVVLNISIDPAGKVIDVTIAKSSGSNEIDLPTMLAVYKWWIEPKKNEQGQPIADRMTLTIRWH